MAQKRMFDKRVVSSDKFYDLPNSSKALYFIAGMEADDKGFFQPRKIQKMCGFTDDDYRILIAKGYFITFDSGVMVVTDWNKNNWLDSRRITETEYVDELKLLKLINDKYELNGNNIGCAKQMLSEYSIEENSIDKNNIYISSKNDDAVDANSFYINSQFEQLWSIYPKKQGKANALKSFTKAIKKKVSYETIENGLNRYIEYINNNHISPQYIKQGSTWFNQECWNDEYTDVQQKSNYQRNKEFLERMLQEDE